MTDKRRFVGPSGGVFVPHPTVDEVSIATAVASGEWTPVVEKLATPQPVKKTARKRTR